MTERCKEEIEEKEIDCAPSSGKCDNPPSPMPVPDWRKTKDPFKNEKEGKYSVTITLTEEIKNLDELDTKKGEEIKISALLEMLDFYGKDEKNVGSVSYDDIDIEKLYVDPRILVKPKVLVSVSSQIFDKIPENLSEQEEEEKAPSEESSDTAASESKESESADVSPEEAPIANYVIFESSEITKMFETVAEKISELSVEAVKLSYQDPGQVLTINLIKEAQRLLGYRSSLISLIEKNGYTLQNIERVKIQFNSDSVRSVEVGPKSNCSKKLAKGFQSFKKGPDVSRQLTNSLVSRLPDIYKDFNSRRSLNYQSFINKYMSNVQSYSQNGYVDRVSAQDIYPFRKYFSEQFETKVLKTQSEVQREEELMTDMVMMKDRYQNLIKEQISVNDPISNSFPDLVKSTGTESDIEFFWQNVVNGMGKRGISSLARVALNKAQENLGVDLNNSIISESFVMNLNNADLANFIRKIPTQAELQENINKTAEDILVGIGIEEYDIPWQNGSQRGSFSSTNPNSDSYNREPLSEFEELMRYGTIATGYRERVTQEVYDAYRQAITENMMPESILAIADINFEGPSFYDVLCLRNKFGKVDIDLQLPKFNGKIGIPELPQIKVPDLLAIVIENAIQAALKLILNTVMMIIEKILSALGDGVCESPSNFGIEDIPVSNLRTIIKNSIPIQGNAPELVDSYMTSFLSSSGFTPDNSPKTRSIVAEFIDDISVTLTENELMLLLKGQPTTEVLVLVSELAKMRDNFLANQLTDPNNVADLFSSLSNFIPQDFLNNQTDPSPINPTSIGICRDEGALDKFSALRCSLLGQNKGLKEEDCKNHLDILKDLAKNDVEDLNNIIQNLDNMIGCSLPDIIANPSCPGEDTSSALLPQIPDQVKQILNSAMSSYFDTLELKIMEELIDHQGFLDMVLVDEFGAGFKQHNNLINGPLGAESPEDWKLLGIFSSHASPASGSTGSSILRNSPTGSIGNFPEEVASQLKENLEEMVEKNYEVTQNNGYDIFTYEYPENLDDYSFYLADTNLNGKEYILKLKESYKQGGNKKVDIFEEEALYVRGEENIDASLGMYISSELGVDINSPTAKKDCIFSTIVSNVPNSKEHEVFIKSFSDKLYFYFYKKYLKEVTNKITEEVSGSTSFSFGYDPEAKPKKICLDPEQFGGTEENPPYYLEPPERYGWLNIYDKIIPEQDGEEPHRSSIINFEEISSKIVENSELFPDDERIYVDTRKMFIPPFYQVLDKSSKAMMEATLRATFRVYIFDIMLKGINIFTKFKPDFTENFDDVLLSYLSENIKMGLLDESKTFYGRKDDAYYLEFLEQTVQIFGNLVDASLAEPTLQEQSAIDYLNQEQSKLGVICESTKKENKKIKLDFLRREDIQKEAMVIFKRYIAEELKKVSAAFEETLDLDAEIVDDIFVQEQGWIHNPIELGRVVEGMTLITDVVADTASEIDPPDFRNNIYGNPPGKFDLSELDYIPFVLERYIKIEDYNDKEAEDKNIPSRVRNRDKNLYGVVNATSWSDYLDSISDITSEKEVSDFWKSWKFGIRISIVPTGDFIDGKNFKDILVDTPEEMCQSSKAYKIGKYNSPLLPFINHEEDIENKSISEYQNGQIVTDFNNNQKCMLFDFFETPQYRSIFKYSMSFSRILSMMGIYTINGFLPSFQDADAAYLGPLRGLKSWNRRTLKKSKDYARIIFESIYNSRDPNYKDRKSRRPTEFFRNNNKIRFSSVDIGLKWFERQLELPRPFDKDGNPKDFIKEDCS